MVRLRVASGISLYDLFQNFFLKEDLGLVSGGDWRVMRGFSFIIMYQIGRISTSREG